MITASVWNYFQQTYGITIDDIMCRNDGSDLVVEFKLHHRDLIGDCVMTHRGSSMAVVLGFLDDRCKRINLAATRIDDEFTNILLK